MRSTRDSVAKSEKSIEHEIRHLEGLTSLHQLRLSHVRDTLGAVENLIGEVRARFSARGIPLYPLAKIAGAKIPSNAQITSDTSMGNGVIILSLLNATYVLRPFHRLLVHSHIVVRRSFYITCQTESLFSGSSPDVKRSQRIYGSLHRILHNIVTRVHSDVHSSPNAPRFHNALRKSKTGHHRRKTRSKATGSHILQ